MVTGQAQRDSLAREVRRLQGLLASVNESYQNLQASEELD